MLSSSSFVACVVYAPTLCAFKPHARARASTVSTTFSGDVTSGVRTLHATSTTCTAPSELCAASACSTEERSDSKSASPRFGGKGGVLFGSAIASTPGRPPCRSAIARAIERARGRRSSSFTLASETTKGTLT